MIIKKLYINNKSFINGEYNSTKFWRNKKEIKQQKVNDRVFYGGKILLSTLLFIQQPIILEVLNGSKK